MAAALWTFTLVRADGSEVSISIRPPEFGDRVGTTRQQARMETDGGTVFVQDLGLSHLLYEATWSNLTRCERSDLERFFGVDGTLFMAREFGIEVTGEDDAAQGISTGLGLSTGEGYSTGQLVSEPGVVWSRVILDQPGLDFTQDARGPRYSVSIRFRILAGPVEALT